MAKASSLGFGVSKPWVEKRHDFVLDSGYRFCRVQDFVSRDCADPSRGSSRAGTRGLHSFAARGLRYT